MDNHSEKAKALFAQGYNCAQALIGAFCDELELDFDRAVRLASSFGGGMGRLREVCGAVTGMFMVVGLKYGYTDPLAQDEKADHYALIQELGHRFRDEHGSIICRDLLGLGSEDQSPVPEKRTQQYYEERPCAELIGYAAQLLDTWIEQKKTEEKTMKIAVASEGKTVAQHFGHCANFNIYEVEDNKIVGTSGVLNPGHRPGFLPNYLNDLGIRVIIAGGMGGGAVEIFNEKGIEVIVGACGNAEDAVKAYLGGTLKSTGSICHQHEHQHECEG